MRECPFCGFEPMPDDGRLCPLCDRDPRETDEAPTVALPAEREGTPPPAEQRVLTIGSLFRERYRVDGICGQGGMGTVYRVRDLVEERDMALKLLHPDVARDADGLERFSREAEILGRLSHPGVPRVYGFVGGSEPHLLTEFIDGRTLKEAMVERGAFPVSETAALGTTLAGALQAAHEHGVVHRDVKPQNVMLSRDGAVKLLDFGVARSVTMGGKTITRTGMVIGTPEYMSPEQLTSHRVDARSDIYSLGVVLFELATGRPPFSADTPLAIALKHKTEPPPPPRELNRSIPAWLERAILRCLEKDKDHRYATAAELGRELSRSRGGVTRRRLPSGDAVIEDPGELSDWALALWSPREKSGWEQGMALRFEERYYRLEEILPPVAREGWTYHLAFWPPTSVFRKVVDYSAEVVEKASREESRLGARLKRLLRR